MPSRKVAKRRKLLDLLLILLAQLCAAGITTFFHTTQVTSLLLFFIIPAAYLTYRIPWILKKGIIYVLASIPFTLIVDYFAIKDGSWWVNTIFPFRILNGIPIEDFIWSASWFYFVIAFYEYFIDEPRGGKDSALNNRYKTLLACWYSAGFLFLVFYQFINTYITIPYFYAFFALGLGIVPLALFLSNRPRILPKFLLVVLYLFGVNFLHEVSALSANQWYFPGKNFIGWVQILSFRIPFEEFALWMVLGAMYVLTWYEYFEDDGK